jgi:quaternary ammonium compound-resistance protein SugE
MSWTYLFIASLFEIAWTFSLKFLDFKKFRQMEWAAFFEKKENFMILLPLLGYIIFGLANVYFFSLAIKNIPASTAMAVWLAIALLGVKIIDIAYFKEPFHWQQVVYFGMIIFGIFGLKQTS